jgi:iron complex transport system permease protein
VTLLRDPAPPARGQAPGRTRPTAATTFVLVAAVGVLAASVLVGSRALPVTALLDPTHPLHAVYDARVDRTLLAVVVGAALGLAGACLQGLTRNPLADPGILGINAGASLAMVVAISAFGVSDLQDYLWFAFLGAAAAAVLVHLVASLGRDGATPVKLAIAGAALTAAVTSWTSAVLLVDRSTMETFRLWQVGTVGGRDTDVLLTGLPFLAVGAVLALTGSRMLNALALGDDVARGLGRRTALDRLVLGLAVVLLAGTATALAGPIAFVGLMAPHAVRAVVGPDYRLVLPLAATVGALLTVLADTLGRVVLPPTEVQVGIMTAVLGAPVFLLLVRRGRLGAL